MRYAGGGFGFISLFHFWAVKTWFSACNSGSVNSFFFLLSTGRHSLFTAITLWVWGSQGNAQTTVFSSSRSKCKEAYHSAHIHSYWSDLFQPRAASVPGCTVWKTCCRPVLLKIRLTIKVDDQSFVQNCSILADSQKFVWRRRSFPPKHLLNDIAAATTHQRKSCNREVFGITIIYFYTNWIKKFTGSTICRVCRHSEQFGKHSEVSAADVYSHTYVSEWSNTKPD